MGTCSWPTSKAAENAANQAHEIAATTARAVIADTAPLSAGFAAFSAAFEDETGTTSTLGPEDFRKTVALETFVTRRDRPGGPAPQALDDAMADYADTIAVHQRFFDEKSSVYTAATTALDRAFATLKDI